MKFFRIVILIFITLLIISCSNNRIATKNCDNDGISFELTRNEDTTPPQDGFDVTLTITNNSNKDYWFDNYWCYYARVYHEDKPVRLRGRPQ